MKVIDNLKDIFATATSDKQDIYREWDRLREGAITPSERSEIDAMFSRAL